MADDKKYAGGKWGDYRSCDAPGRVFEDWVDHVAARSDLTPRLIYFTGDIVGHTIDAQNTIIPTLGNHDTYPSNFFAPEWVKDSNMSTSWLYVAEIWKCWLPTSALETLAKGGYYSVLVRNYLRIIVLNNSVAQTFNWWILNGTRSLYSDQFMWLVVTLSDAEKNGETVHILSHFPMGDPRMDVVWDETISEIYTPFSHIIKGIFNGHTHMDEIGVFLKKNTQQPSIVLFNGGGLTTWRFFNPNYHVLIVDSINFNIIDYEQWYYDLKTANERGETEWKQGYRFNEMFDIKTDLTPKVVLNLIKQMAQENPEGNAYWNKYVEKFVARVEAENSPISRELAVCHMITNVFADTSNCQEHLNVPTDTLKHLIPTPIEKVDENPLRGKPDSFEDELPSMED